MSSASTVAGTADGGASGDLRRRLLAIPSLLCGMLSVQCGASLAKSLFPAFGPAGMVMMRTGFAAAALLILLRVTGSTIRLRGGRSAILRVLAYGASLAVMNLLFYESLVRLPLGIAVAVEFMGPLFLAVAGSRRLGDLLWAALAIGGLLLLLDPFGGHDPVDPVGLLFAAGAAAGWALYILTGRRLGQSVEGLAATALGMSVGALVALPFGAATISQALAHPALLLAAFGVAMLSSALPYPIEMMAMRRMSTRTFAVLMSLEPGLAAVIGLVLLHEALSLRGAVAVAMVVVASLGSALFDIPPPDTREPRPD
ncbi:EamA family transporter [Rhizosaccharibacter radicis]|uniref:EamA family transporter n=1 Tax=Rhizosaccharibacter radicis TaxID=2782605 RepID=A0ABT1VXG0_9PROT|nr:EamA family transporter [Acetobacteraceae bacterium KSS12]